MTPFTKRAIESIKNIPQGRVMTYGQIARIAGNHRAARQISRILHSMSENHRLPWHRVVNSQGRISLKGEGYDIQHHLLVKEGIVINEKGVIDLKKYQYHM